MKHCECYLNIKTSAMLSVANFQSYAMKAR